MVFIITVKILLHKRDPSVSSPKELMAHRLSFISVPMSLFLLCIYTGLMLYETEQKRDRSAWALMGGQSKSMLPKAPALTTMPL